MIGSLEYKNARYLGLHEGGKNSDERLQVKILKLYKVKKWEVYHFMKNTRNKPKKKIKEQIMYKTLETIYNCWKALLN